MDSHRQHSTPAASLTAAFALAALVCSCATTQEQSKAQQTDVQAKYERVKAQIDQVPKTGCHWATKEPIDPEVLERFHKDGMAIAQNQLVGTVTTELYWGQCKKEVEPDQPLPQDAKK